MAEGKKHALTGKQRRFLFARGILRSVGAGGKRKVIYQKAREAGIAAGKAIASRVDAGKVQLAKRLKSLSSGDVQRLRSRDATLKPAREDRPDAVYSPAQRARLRGARDALAGKPDYSATRAARVAAGKRAVGAFGATERGKAISAAMRDQTGTRREKMIGAARTVKAAQAAKAKAASDNAAREAGLDAAAARRARIGQGVARLGQWAGTEKGSAFFGKRAPQDPVSEGRTIAALRKRQTTGAAARKARVAAGRERYADFIRKGATPRAIAVLEARGRKRQNPNLLNAADLARKARAAR